MHRQQVDGLIKSGQPFDANFANARLDFQYGIGPGLLGGVFGNRPAHLVRAEIQLPARGKLGRFGRAIPCRLELPQVPDSPISRVFAMTASFSR